MTRIKATALWLLVFSLFCLSIALFIIGILNATSPQSTNSPPSSIWIFAAAGGLIAASVFLFRIWRNIAIHKQRITDTINKYGGSHSISVRLLRASIGDIEIVYYFQKDFMSYNLAWLGPDLSRTRRLIQRWNDEGSKWIASKYFWRLLQALSPLVVFLPENGKTKDQWKAIKNDAEKIAKGSTVEVWISRKNSGDEYYKVIAGDDDDSFTGRNGIWIIIYIAPWNGELICRIIEKIREYA